MRPEPDRRLVKPILFMGIFWTAMASIFFQYMTTPSTITVTYRLFWTVLLLTPLVFTRHRQELFSLDRRELGWCALAGVFLALHFCTWFESLHYTSITSSTVLVNTEAMFAAVGLFCFFRQKISARETAAILIAFGGSVLIALADSGGGKGALLGDLLSLLAAAFSALYTLIGTRQRTHMSTTVYTYVLYAASLLTLLVIDLVTGTPLLGYQPIDYAMSLCLAVFCTLLGHSVFSWSLKFLSPTYVTTAKLTSPLFASLAALLLFQEVPGPLQLTGGAVVLAGLWLYTKGAEG